MQIKIKIEASQLVGIDIYEVEDSSLEATLAAILGTYVTDITPVEESTSVLSVPSVELTQTNNYLEKLTDYKQMSTIEWSYAVTTLLENGDGSVFTNWLDKVFGSEIFSQAKSVNAIVTSGVKIGTLSFATWSQIVAALVRLECVKPISSKSVYSYHKSAQRKLSV